MSHPVFGRHSRAMLNSSEHRLVLLSEEVLRFGMDFKVICGHRPEEPQHLAFEQGLSKTDWPDSKHNKLPSLAIDVAPYPIDWMDTERFYHLIGLFRAAAILLDIPIRSGLDWDNDFVLRDQKFMDLGHLELIG